MATAANTLVIVILVWNGFVRGFIVLSYVPKLVDGAMPFALGAAQCFAVYFAAHVMVFYGQLLRMLQVSAFF
jgi:hypothetical protein